MPVMLDEIRYVFVDRIRNGESKRKVGLKLNIYPAIVNRIWIKCRKI